MGFWDWEWEDVYSPFAASVRRALQAQKASADFVATLQRAAQIARLATNATDPGLSEKLIQFADGVDALTGQWQRARDVMIDVAAVGKMVKAWKATDKDAIIRDPKAAAYAFGELFGSAGRIARHLPPPLNAFGSFLESLAGGWFWETARNVNSYLDPTSQHGAQMEAVRREIDGY